MGSPAVSVTILQGLIHAGHSICGVLTQPDKPAGRGQILTPPPVKAFSEIHSLKIFQPTRLKDPSLHDELRNLKPDVSVVAAYGRILPSDLLQLAPLGCWNVHFSLLPKYRGSSCVASAISNGDSETGVTIMKVVEELDAGPVLCQERVLIGDDETAGELEERLAHLASPLLNEALSEIESGAIHLMEQNSDDVTLAPLIRKEQAQIDWNQPAAKVSLKVRAMNPWPVAYTFLNGQRLKVFQVNLSSSKSSRSSPGEIVAIHDEGIQVACKEGDLILKEVQPESKKRMQASEYARGSRDGVVVGKKFE